MMDCAERASGVPESARMCRVKRRAVMNSEEEDVRERR